MSDHPSISSNLPSTGIHPQLPPGYRARRGLNWGFIGMLYMSFYMCRYNLSLANQSICAEFGFSKAQMGTIITTMMLAYAFGQIINGLITDRVGGKRAMLIGAIGTITMNVLFGIASFWGLLWLFVTIRGIDGYMQAFGAPGTVKINAAWFGHTERGRFAGIFGFMVNSGRFGIFKLGPALLVGFTFLGLWRVPPLHWRWLFWIPAGVTTIAAICLVLIVKDTPEEAHFPAVSTGEAHTDDVRASFTTVFMTIVSNPVVWVIAFAYACTGAVRQGIDQWFPRLLQEVHGITLDSAQFQWIGFLIPLVAATGSLASGYISDTLCKGRRAPVAAALYFAGALFCLGASQFHSANAAIVFLVLISFTANSTHSILGTAAAMDVGGVRMAGFASGLIDSFQYFGGSLAGYFLGKLLDHSWDWYFYSMVPFGIVGGLLMLTILGRVSLKKQPKH
jgi:OPA family glycerol-3-phosphate transporter-like MFS transporter